MRRRSLRRRGGAAVAAALWLAAWHAILPVVDGTTGGDDRSAACAATLDRLAELADETLPSAERAALEAHVDACPECRARLAALRDALASRAEPPGALDDATREALLGVFRAWRARRADR